MSFTAKDGSRHTNRSTMMSADARFNAKQPMKKMGGGAPGADGDPDEGMGDAGDTQDGAALAAEHGPATHLEISHEGGHHVHAEHPDGHAHDSEHSSAAEAHKFAADCAGVGAEGSSDDEGQF